MKSVVPFFYFLLMTLGADQSLRIRVDDEDERKNGRARLASIRATR